MFRRIGYFLIGAGAIFQAYSVFPNRTPFTHILMKLILHPFDFLFGSLLFLIGFLMLSPLFSHFIRMFYLLPKKKITVKGKDIVELVVSLAVLFVLFYTGFWLPFFACLFAFIYGWFSVDFRIERELNRNRG